MIYTGDNIPEIIDRRKEDLKAVAKVIQKKHNLDTTEATEEDLQKAEKEYIEEYNKIINEDINSNQEIKNRVDKYSFYVNKNKEAEDLEKGREENIPEWARESGSIVEGLYKTIVKRFPQSFQKVRLGTTGVELKSFEDDLNNVNKELKEGKVKPDDKVL